MTKTINFGIDLGTTNSAIAKFDGNEFRIYKNKDQMEVTPSVVRIDKGGRILVGRKAYDSRISNPGNIALEFKRILGQSDKISFAGVTKTYGPDELSAEVLKSLLDDARRLSGEPIESVVITVPAAFSHLQCEATARAATLAGLKTAALLQEPIAAAIAYGLKPDARDKTWLVYDLGGGTFDLAVVSTKDGRLAVVEHAGDAFLGGKDMDHLIVDKLILPELSKRYAIPKLNTNEGLRLKQALYKAAEEVKIELSFSASSIISILDAGNDEDGEEIVFEMECQKNVFELLVEPFILQTIDLCRTTMEQARMPMESLSAILLVGGPTQMPVLRRLLQQELKVPLEFSIDPMTVVARGAAVYASTLEMETEENPAGESEKAVTVQLAYEAVSPGLAATVLGRILEVPAALPGGPPTEFCVNANTGHWSSGWVPLRNDLLETTVTLLAGRTTIFTLSLRDKVGNSVPCSPNEFSIRHGMGLAQPPLPHSVAAEVVLPDGSLGVDVLFARSTPLPAQRTATYRARRMLRPSKTEDSLAFKLWEGEFQAPDDNTWLGELKIRSEDIRRPIPEGAEVQVHISIDASRKMEVHAYVPAIDQHFQEHVYVPEENEESALAKADAIGAQFTALFNRLHQLQEQARNAGDAAIGSQLDDLLVELEDASVETEHLQRDPDRAKRMLKRVTAFRGRLGDIERYIQTHHGLLLLRRKLNEWQRGCDWVVAQHGTASEKAEFSQLALESEQWSKLGDQKAIKKITDQFYDLWWGTISRQPWYWKDRFDVMAQPNVDFVRKDEANQLLAEGKAIVTSGDFMALRRVVQLLWNLRPNTAAEQDRQRGTETGLRLE